MKFSKEKSLKILKCKKEKGITLIALVITIIVLLILAGVTIATLAGENGILTKTTEAKDETTQAKAEEMVKLAIGSLQTKNLGDTNQITPEAIANQVMEDNYIENVIAEESEFPTNIVFEDEGIKVGVNIDFEVGSIGSYDGIYSEPGLEGKTAPEDLFDYEIIDDGNLASTQMNSLPEKTVRITRIKPKFCNENKYNPDTGKYDLEKDTNYAIDYDNDVITKESTLIIPYRVDGEYIPDGIKGEMYKITEVSLSVKTAYDSALPAVKTIILPNTVKKIYNWSGGVSYENQQLNKVILSNDLEEIGNNVFYNCINLSEITIPENVTVIGEKAFYGCEKLTNIVIPRGVTNIGASTFSGCNKLENITIQDGITSIGDRAFRNCYSLTNVEIPNSVKSIGKEAFEYCKILKDITLPKELESIGSTALGGCYELSHITIPDSITSIGSYAFQACNKLSNITYKGTTYTSKTKIMDILQSNNVTCDSTIFNGTAL